MATVAEGVFPLPELDSTRVGKISRIEVDDSPPKRVEVIDLEKLPVERVELESAEVIVAGGAGAGDSEGWAEIAELAKLLQAGLGSTRPAVH